MLQGINEKLQRANSKADEAINVDNKQDSDLRVSLRSKIALILLLVCITRISNKIYIPE